MTTEQMIGAIGDPMVRELAMRGQTRTFPKNAVIINEGDRGDSLFVILSGKVKVYVSDDDGREMILDTYAAGDYVGEMSLDGRPRSASVMTLEPTTCAVVMREELRAAIAQNPDVAMTLIGTLIDRARIATDNVKNLALMDVYGRVARLLLSLAKEEGGKLVVPEKMTQQDIADRVGASRDMISRIFKDLTIGGYVTIENRQITINRKPPARW
ncbi:MAG: Crp/Fnr family transcriptional regulator [Burkholderiaceae bacterium]